MVFLQGKEVMHAFIALLKEEGVTYVAPWRPPAQPAIQPTEGSTPPQPKFSTGEETGDEEETEGAVGYTLATTSSDFGSMSIDEAAALERARKSKITL
mgnify:CR=1 FL=1